MARGGTEFFPDLGAQCDEPDCIQLDFLPFECDGCGGSFCAAHRTYRDHGCAKAAADEGRTVVVCPDCGDSIEHKAPEQAEREILDAHVRSRLCDPARKRSEPPQCPVPRCKEALTCDCNKIQCRDCGLKVCLNHRFPADHGCAGAAAAARRAAGAQYGRGAAKKGAGHCGWPLAVSIRRFKISNVARIPAAIKKAVLRVIRKKSPLPKRADST